MYLLLLYLSFKLISLVNYLYNRLKFLLWVNQKLYILHLLKLKENEIKLITKNYISTKGYLVFKNKNEKK